MKKQNMSVNISIHFYYRKQSIAFLVKIINITGFIIIIISDQGRPYPHDQSH